MDRHPVHTYSRATPVSRSLVVASWCVLLLLAVAGMVSPGQNSPEVVRGLAALMALGAAYFIFRAVGWGTIAVYGDSVVVKGLFRTSRFSRRDIDRFTTADGFNALDEPAHVLAVRTHGGEMHVFADFRSDDGAQSMTVKQLASQLNDWIAAA